MSIENEKCSIVYLHVDWSIFATHKNASTKERAGPRSLPYKNIDIGLHHQGEVTERSTTYKSGCLLPVSFTDAKMK